jgi:hypothetical protein
VSAGGDRPSYAQRTFHPMVAGLQS